MCNFCTLITTSWLTVSQRVCRRWPSLFQFLTFSLLLLLLQLVSSSTAWHTYFLLMFLFTAHRGTKTLICVSLCVFSCRKANEGLLTLSQEETMPISIRQLAYGTVNLHFTLLSVALIIGTDSLLWKKYFTSFTGCWATWWKGTLISCCLFTLFSLIFESLKHLVMIFSTFSSSNSVYW